MRVEEAESFRSGAVVGGGGYYNLIFASAMFLQIERERDIQEKEKEIWWVGPTHISQFLFNKFITKKIKIIGKSILVILSQSMINDVTKLKYKDGPC